jgi:hypothetical protein
MNWTDWIPAISTSTILAVLGFAIGPYYKGRIEKGIQYNFDLKLEELRSRFRIGEEEFKANLRTKDDQISVLRSGALSGMVSRQEVLDKRRLEALEKLWGGVIDRWPLKHLSRMVVVINMDYALDAAAQQTEEARRIREFAEVIWKSSGLDSLKSMESSDKERPFIPPIVWALFSAYRQILNLSVAQISVLRTGAGKKILADPKDIVALVKSALPHQSKLVDEFGSGALPHLLEELEEKLLAEIIASLNSAASDNRSIEQAAAILKAVERVTISTEEKLDLPDVSGLRA